MYLLAVIYFKHWQTVQHLHPIWNYQQFPQLLPVENRCSHASVNSHVHAHKGNNHFSWSLFFCRDKQVDKKHFSWHASPFISCGFFSFFSAERKGFKARYIVFLPHVLVPLPSPPLFSAPIGRKVRTALAHNIKTNIGLSQDRCGSTSFSENNRGLTVDWLATTLFTTLPVSLHTQGRGTKVFFHTCEPAEDTDEW